MKKKIGRNIIHIVTMVFLVFYLCDKVLVSLDKSPVFAIVTNYFKDGGTECRIGIGYSVILWHSVSSFENNDKRIHGYEIGKEFINFPIGYLNFYGINFEPKKELKFVEGSNNEEENIMDMTSTNVSFALDSFVLIIPLIYTIIIIFLFIYYLRIIYKTYKKKNK